MSGEIRGFAQFAVPGEAEALRKLKHPSRSRLLPSFLDT